MEILVLELCSEGERLSVGADKLELEGTDSPGVVNLELDALPAPSERSDAIL